MERRKIVADGWKVDDRSTIWVLFCSGERVERKRRRHWSEQPRVGSKNREMYKWNARSE